MQGYLLDTHIWIWLQEGDRENLKRSAFEDAERWLIEGRLNISAISIWEISLLTASKRIQLFTSIDTWVRLALEDPNLSLLPLDPEILIASTRLPGELHRDPADRMIVATARHYGLILLTRDTPLLQYGKQGHLKVQKF